MRGGEWEVISSGLVEDSPPLCFFCRQNYSLKLQIGWENSGHLRKLKCHRRWHYASGMLLLLSSSTWCCHIVLTFQLFQPHDSVSFSSLYLCGLYGRKCAMFVPSRGQMRDLDRSVVILQYVITAEQICCYRHWPLCCTHKNLPYDIKVKCYLVFAGIYKQKLGNDTDLPLFLCFQIKEPRSVTCKILQ